MQLDFMPPFLHLSSFEHLSADKSMEKDTELLQNLDPLGPPLLRFYTFETPSATFGYFQNPKELLKEHLKGLTLAKRPTGGGLLFHLNDLTFSLFIPQKHPLFTPHTQTNYKTIHTLIMEGINQYLKLEDKCSLFPASSDSPLFCMAKPACYDIMLKGKKIVGGAQRKTKQGLLHQGSISLKPIPDRKLKAWLKSEDIIKQMQTYAGGFLSPQTSNIHVNKIRASLKTFLASYLQERLA